MTSFISLPYFHGTIDLRECREQLTGLGDFLVRNYVKTIDTKFDETHCACVLTIGVTPEQASITEKDVKNCSLKMDTLPRLRSYPINGDPTGTSFSIPGVTETFASVQALCDSFMTSKQSLPNGGQLLRVIPRKPWQLLLSDISFPSSEVVLGKGSFGKVVKAKLLKQGADSVDVAVKSSKDENSAEIFSEMYAEARIMRALTHPNIIRLEGVVVEKFPIMLVIEYIDGNCLLNALIKKTVPNEMRFPIVMGILYGLQYMHQNKYIHRDVAARNVMISNDFRTVKIIDFGLAKHGLEFTLTQCSKIPVKWLAPEILINWTFTTKTDTWAFGVCIWEIYHDGAEPYSNVLPKAATPVSPTTGKKEGTVRRKGPQASPTTPKKKVEDKPDPVITQNLEWLPKEFLPLFQKMFDRDVRNRIELSFMANEIEKKILPTLPQAVQNEAKIHLEKRPQFDPNFKVEIKSIIAPPSAPTPASKKSGTPKMNTTRRRVSKNSKNSRTNSRNSTSTGDSDGSVPSKNTAGKVKTQRRKK